MSIVDRIVELCNKTNTKGIDLGKVLGLKKSPLTDWKNKKSNPTVEQIIKICDYFAISSDYLLFGSSSSHIEKPDLEDTISVDEQNIIDIYRDIDDTGKREVQRCIREIWSVHKTEKKDVSSDSVLENKIG